ncbi:hypothetical protein Pla108_13430 [Botrimarina colliarenosi]|uniref:Uncharacterized protein n=1 Tax=Botrimarina colliarenosi TaxID=2528001 RepID=A0A5C6AK34_9BACT|nr:hypothetical protein Pla108_13430 [Botrimarina colliarenosi]
MATQIQSSVSGTLSELRFENLGAEMPGAPSRFRATAATLALVQSLLDESRVIEVGSGGEIAFDRAT